MEDKGIKPNIIDKLFQASTSKKTMLHAFAIFVPAKRNVFSSVVLLGLSVIAACIISTGQNTVSLFVNSVDMILTVLIELFGIIFAGYAIFQAILSEKMLIKMLQYTTKKDLEEKSLLQTTNENFVELMMLTILGIIVSVFIKLILGGINQEFALFPSEIVNEVCSGFLCALYYFFSATIMWEMKSFVFNIFQLFNAYSGARILEIIENNQE